MFTEVTSKDKTLAGENPHNRPHRVPAASSCATMEGHVEVSNPKERELQIEKRVRKIVERTPEFQDLLYR